MRSLTADEAALWARVAATIRPLSREVREQMPVTPPESPKALVLKPTPVFPRASIVPAKPRPGTTLDGSWDRKIKSGQLSPDRTLDLHGQSLEGAWWAMDQALERAIAADERVLLLITGHQRRGEPPVERGKIRAAVHDWLAASRHAARIAAVRGAHPRHGGGGSLYIVLRRR